MSPLDGKFRRRSVRRQFSNAAQTPDGKPVEIPVETVDISAKRSGRFSNLSTFQQTYCPLKGDKMLMVARKSAAVRKLMDKFAEGSIVRFVLPNSEPDSSAHLNRYNIELRRSKRDGKYYVRDITLG
jgi:hypothetical protein